MKMPSDHYKGPNATSKGHTPLLILVPPWENVNKPMNLKSAIMVTWFIKLKLARFEIQGCPTVIWSLIQTLTLTHNELLANLGVWIVMLQMAKTLGPDRLWGILTAQKPTRTRMTYTELCLKSCLPSLTVLLLQFCNGIGESWGWDLSISTDERLQDSIMDEDILILGGLWDKGSCTVDITSWDVTSYSS